VFAVRIDWMEVAARTVLPQIEPSAALAATVVAVFGTTISPYLFFWQAAEEVEEERADPDDAPLSRAPEQAPAELARIGWDTYLGMAFSNLIAFFIILTAASTLHAAGHTDIRSAAEAAEALRPVAGEFAFLLFALGIVGTGLLAVPVLAGSAAYAVAEAMGWPYGLERTWSEAKGFYAVLTLATLAGLGVLAAPVDPFQALYLSAVLNGLISAPVLAAMMIVATRKAEMGAFTATRGQRFTGWAATAVMAAAAAAMVILR
jgi:Mn2+/Fe2+ NRAMP family transporter